MGCALRATGNHQGLRLKSFTPSIVVGIAANTLAHSARAVAHHQLLRRRFPPPSTNDATVVFEPHTLSRVGLAGNELMVQRMRPSCGALQVRTAQSEQLAQLFHGRAWKPPENHWISFTIPKLGVHPRRNHRFWRARMMNSDSASKQRQRRNLNLIQLAAAAGRHRPAPTMRAAAGGV